MSLASGRTLPNVTPIKQSLGVSGFIVAENGGMVWDSGEGREIVALADGSRARAAAEWLGTQIEGFDGLLDFGIHGGIRSFYAEKYGREFSGPEFPATLDHMIAGVAG